MPRSVRKLDPQGLEIGEKLRWKYDQTSYFDFFPWSLFSYAKILSTCRIKLKEKKHKIHLALQTLGMNNRPDKVGKRAVTDGLAIWPRLHVQLHCQEQVTTTVLLGLSLANLKYSINKIFMNFFLILYFWSLHSMIMTSG